jgi:hypothetical protein
MPDTNTDGRILQLAAAFGHGAGVVLATEEALLTALHTYEDNVRRLEDWDTDALHAIEFSRVLGSLAATHALVNGRAVIDVEDVQYALSVVRANERTPLGLCRITAAHHRS